MFERDRRRHQREPLGGVRVTPEPFESIDSVARRFKKAVERNGVLNDARRHEYFVSPSERRRLKRFAARRRVRV